MAEGARHLGGQPQTRWIENTDVYSAAQVLLDYAYQALDSGEDGVDITHLISGVRAVLDSLSPALRIHKSLVEEQNPIARRARIKERLMEIREQFPIVRETGIIKLVTAAEKLPDDATLSQIKDHYEKKLQPYKQIQCKQRLYQEHRPDDYDYQMLLTAEAKIKTLEEVRDEHIAARRTLLEERAFGKAEENVPNHISAMVQQLEEQKKEQEVEAWLASLNENTRGVLAEALSEKKSQDVEPYRLRDEPYLLIRQANEVLRRIIHNRGKITAQEKEIMRKKAIQLLALEKVRPFILAATEVIQDCQEKAAPSKNSHQKGWRRDFAYQIETLANIVPTEEQIKGSNISRAMVKKVHSTLENLLRVLGMTGPEVRLALKKQRNFNKGKGRTPDEEDENQRIQELLGLISRTPKKGIRRKSSVHRSAKKRRNAKAGRAKGFTEVDQPNIKSKTESENVWDQ